MLVLTGDCVDDDNNDDDLINKTIDHFDFSKSRGRA